MRSKRYFFGLFILVINLIACQQNSKKLVDDAIGIYYVVDFNSYKFKKYTEQNNINKINYLVESEFLDNNNFTFNKVKLLAHLNKTIPDSLTLGYGQLDIEDPYIQILQNESPSSQRFKKALKLYIDVFDFVKMHRPNIKWGYYSFPFTTYWNRNQDFYSKNNKVNELLKKVDVFYPSMYVFYNTVNFNLENEAYLKDNTKEAIKWGKAYNKRVLVYIMDRYHPSNRLLKYKQINANDFSSYVYTIASTEVDGKSVDGIVLWNADEYFFNIKESTISEDYKKSSFKNFKNYYEDYMFQKMKKMKNVIECNR